MFTHIVVRYLMYAVALSISVLMLVETAQAGVNVWQKDDSYVDVGLLIQTQGRVVDGGGAGTDANTDSIFFRRLRPFFYGAFNKNWQGIIQMDFGEGFEGRMPAKRPLNGPICSIRARSQSTEFVEDR